MATATGRGANIGTSSGTWVNTNNAFDGAFGSTPGTQATWTSAVASASAFLEVRGYDMSAIPAGSTITAAQVVINHTESSTTLISTVNVELFSGGSGFGATGASKSTLAHSTTCSMFPPSTLAQLQDATFGVRVTVVKSSTASSSVFSVDYMDLTITYTPPAGPPKQAAIPRLVGAGVAAQRSANW